MATPLTPLALDADQLTAIDGLVLGRVLKGRDAWLCAWELPSLALRWRVSLTRASFRCVGAVVCVMRADPQDGPYEVLDLATGQRARSYERFDWLMTGSLTSDGESLFSLGENSVERRTVADGSLVQSARLRADWSEIVGMSGDVVIVQDDYSAVAAFDRRTLARRWTLADLRIQSLLPSRTTLFMSGETNGPSGGTGLFAFDADTGVERWRSSTPANPVASNAEVLLTADAVGWVTARDASTGAMRWQQWLGARARRAAADGEGFVVLTEDGIVALGAEGVERARWAARSTDEPPSVLVAGPWLVCGNLRDVESRPTEAFAPRTASTPVLAREVPVWEWPEGRSFRAPCFTHLDALRALLLSIDDGDEAWEALAARGFIPVEWIQSDARRFFCPPNRWELRPEGRGAMLSIAADVEGIVCCEALLREVSARLLPWGTTPNVPPVRWNLTDRFAPRVGVDLYTLLLEPLRALYSVFGSDSEESLHAEIANVHPTDLVCNSEACRALVGEALWQAAVRYDLALGVAETHPLHGRRFASLKSPFEPLLAIMTMGYVFDPNGNLLALPFVDDLSRCRRAPDDLDIPF